MELWDIYTQDRIKTEKTMVRGHEFAQGSYHLVVHACVFNSKGEMLIQQRQPFKLGWENMWDITVGGSAVSGDTSQMAVERELFEEIGLRFDFENIRPHLTINFEFGFDDIYLIEKDVNLGELKLQYEEVQNVKWASEHEVLTLLETGEFVPYHKNLIQLFFSMKNKYGVHHTK